MTVFRRRQKDWSELIGDPRTMAMIWRLVGASEMAVALLPLADSEIATRVAGRLEAASVYFMEDIPAKEGRYGWDYPPEPDPQ